MKLVDFRWDKLLDPLQTWPGTGNHFVANYKKINLRWTFGQITMTIIPKSWMFRAFWMTNRRKRSLEFAQIADSPWFFSEFLAWWFPLANLGAYTSVRCCRLIPLSGWYERHCRLSPADLRIRLGKHVVNKTDIKSTELPEEARKPTSFKWMEGNGDFQSFPR